MSLLTSHGEANLVIDEALTVTYSKSVISGSWGYTSANVSGTYYTMKELHRYARKTFRYVGMTYAAAKACKAAMIAKFTRQVWNSYWNGDAMGGGWNVDSGGEMLMADVSCVHVEGDCWEVHVSVNEDDVRFIMANQIGGKSNFYNERLRTYGSDAHGISDEKESDSEPADGE